MYETVYHGVPVVTMPVFCDHDSNSAKAEVDGYAKKIDLLNLSSDKLYKAIKEVIDEPKYKVEVKKRQILLKDQYESPLDRAVYWTEYVIRHKGAYHLQSPAKDLNYFQYHMLDVVFYLIVTCLAIFGLMCYVLRVGFKSFIDYVQSRPIVRHSNKIIKHSDSLLKKSNKLLSQSMQMKKKL